MLRSPNWRWLIIWLGLAAGVNPAGAFSLWGTKEDYQEIVLGYGRVTETEYPGSTWWVQSGEDLFAPHNLGEEYRWSLPTLYYTYDASFVEYFASNGIYAVDSAFALVTKAFTNNPTGETNGVDGYSADLAEVPLDEARFNYTAKALHLFDLKSAALEMIVGRLGLADPERWTWTIRARIPIPGLPCPFYDYKIIQRNFDPVTFEPSKYVNGNLFTYVIRQHCPPELFGRGDAEEFLVDPLGTYQTAVASPKITFPTVINEGMFHVGLTRDDVGGLRYLYRTNNLNVEMAPPGSILFNTNYNALQLLVTSNLTLLAAQALTNDAAALTALFPGLIIANTTPFFTNVVTTNATAYFTNYPWSPAGSAPVLVFATNYTTNVAAWYHHSFANVVTNSYYTNGIARLQTITVGPCPLAPPGLICTNVTFTTVATNLITGDYFILPTNSQCGFSMVSTQLVTSFILTNAILGATNTTSVTNGTTATNITQEVTQNEITYFTNHIYVIHPVDCVTNSVALRQGLQKISFVRHDFDSLLGRYFYPITNIYTRIAVTNNQTMLQRFQRVVTQPDILIAAADIDVPVTDPEVNTVQHNGSSTPSLNSSNAIPQLAGPGTIESPFTLTFNKVGPLRLNFSPYFLTEANGIFYFNWASFDGSTNAPVVYPSDKSLADLENQILITVSPSSLSAGRVGTNYTVALSVAGGQPPYDWSLGPGSPDLPPALILTPDPADSSRATLSGPLIADGSFPFLIRLTDAGSRYVDTFYVLQVDP